MFKGGPIQNILTLATLGLSKVHLKLRKSGKLIRQELVFLLRDTAGTRNLPGVLQELVHEILQRGEALPRGIVIGPRGPLLEDSTVEALYVTAPVYFPDSFHVFRPADGSDPIVLVWLVPITSKEAEYVRSHGWESFEERLAHYDPDLLDIHRASMPLC